MTYSQEAKDLANELTNAKRRANTFFYTRIQQWLKIQVRLNNFSKTDASRDFEFDEITDTTIDFTSEDWEETWSYGGHENHYGRTIQIPFDFFDDETPYLKKADDYESEIERLQKVREKRIKKEHVKKLEAQLEAARKAVDE